MNKNKSFERARVRVIRTHSFSAVSTLMVALTLSGTAVAQSTEVIDDQVNDGEVTIPGDHPSPWELDYFLVIGDEGKGTLTIENGGEVRMTGSFGTTLAREATGDGNIIISGTDGAGKPSTLFSSAGFVIGSNGRGSLLIENGALAQSTTSAAAVRIGANSGAVGVATVTGTDGQGNPSSWLNNGALYVGAAGSGGSGSGTLTILDGGLVTSGSAGIYGPVDGGEGIITVSGVNADGTPSTLNAEGGPMAIGARGRGVLRIEDGGIVRNFAGIIARNADAASEATVTGAGSHWISGAGLSIGEQGEGLLTVTDGGRASANGVSIGAKRAGHGILKVSGVDGSGNPSTVESNNSVSVGDWGSGEMVIEGGAQVIGGAYGSVAANLDTIGTVLISGTDSNGTASTWSSVYSLSVGAQGEGELRIVDGAAATAGASIVISDRDAAKGTVVVSGTDAAGNGSRLSAAEDLRVGSRGTGTLTVTKGAAVSASEAYIGYSENSTGTLNIGAAADEVAARAGSLDAEFLQFRDGDGTLIFNHTDDNYRFEAGLDSNGSGTHIVEHRAGHTTLTGDGSGFAGRTTLSGGTLIVGLDGKGSLGGDIDALTSTRLGGSGTIGSPGSHVTIGSGATVAPGNSIGTLAVGGDVTFAADSIFEVEIAGGGTTPGVHNDLLRVDGMATLEGGTVDVVTLDPETSYQDWQVYTILTAEEGVEGEFVEAVSDSAFITTELTHNPDNVILGVGLVKKPEPDPDPKPDPIPDPEPDPDPTPDPEPDPDPGPAPTPDPEPGPEPSPGLFPTAAGTYNQTQAATGLDDLDQTPGSDALAVYNQILMLSKDEAQRAFDLTSGEIHASGQHVITQSFSLFSRTLRQQAGSADGQAFTSPLACKTPTGSTEAAMPDRPDACVDARVSNIWVAPVGGRGTIDGDGNAADLDWWNVGFVGGYERALDVSSGNALAGFGLGYIRSHGRIDDRRSEFDADGLYVGIYGAWKDGPWSLAGSLAYAANDISTERDIVFGGINRTAKADYWAHSVGLSTEAAYGIALGSATTLSPLVTVDIGWSGHEAFNEKGADALNLKGDSESWTQFDTGLGVALEHSVGSVTLRGRAVWEHAFADVTPDQSMRLVGSPTSFDVRGPDAGRDRLRLGLGLAWNASDDVSLRVNYDGLFSGRQHSNMGSVRLNIRF